MNFLLFTQAQQKHKDLTEFAEDGIVIFYRTVSKAEKEKIVSANGLVTDKIDEFKGNYSGSS